jgi:hypothetical protein
MLAEELFDLASGTSSYNRAYGTMVRVQQLTEVEEVLQCKKMQRKHGFHGFNGFNGCNGFNGGVVKEHRQRTQAMWRDRLLCCHQKVEVYVPLLLARSLMPSTTSEATHDLPTWLRFVKLCQSSEQIGCNRLPLSLKTMTALGANTVVEAYCGGSGGGGGGGGGSGNHHHHNNNGRSNNYVFNFIADVSRVQLRGTRTTTTTNHHHHHDTFQTTTVHPRVALAYVEHLWAADQRTLAVGKLKCLLECVTSFPQESLATGKGAFQYCCGNDLLCDLYLRQGEWLQQNLEADESNSDSPIGGSNHSRNHSRNHSSNHNPRMGGGLRQPSQSLSRSTRTLEAVLESFEAATRMDPLRYVEWLNGC